MEQRAVALEIQPSGILDLNLDSNMVRQHDSAQIEDMQAGISIAD
ncbi:hypothetical protein Gorai_019006, partial [Gossypium raimondii]|nr:hypothetical protein [Gossypium raimondii]